MNLAYHTTEDMGDGDVLNVWIDEFGDICLGDRAGHAMLSFPAHHWQLIVDAIEQTGTSWDLDESE